VQFLCNIVILMNFYHAGANHVGQSLMARSGMSYNHTKVNAYSDALIENSTHCFPQYT